MLISRINFFEQNPKLSFLHDRALNLVSVGDEKSLSTARYLLLHILKFQPNDSNALYNLACVESLIGNVEGAIVQLKNAISAGFNDVQHIVEDPDFDNIRNTEGFKECIQYFSKINQEEEVTNNDIESVISTNMPEPIETETKAQVLEPESIEDPILEYQDPIRNILIEMGISIEEEKLKELCHQFSDDVTQILNHYFRAQ